MSLTAASERSIYGKPLIDMGVYLANFSRSWNFCCLLVVQRSCEYALHPFLKGIYVGSVRRIDTTGKVVTGVGYGQETDGSRHNLKIRQHFRQ